MRTDAAQEQTAGAAGEAAAQTVTAEEKEQTAEVAQTRPLRLARVPLVVESPYAGADVREMLEEQVDRLLHVPLNETLKAVEEIPQGEVEDALRDVFADLRGTKKRVKFKDAMQPLAEKLDADLVVCPVLSSYHEFIYYGGFGWGWHDGDTMLLDSYAALELDGYDRSEDENFSKRTSRYYRGSYMPASRAANLAKDALLSLAQQTDINRRVMRTVRERAGRQDAAAQEEQKS